MKVSRSMQVGAAILVCLVAILASASWVKNKVTETSGIAIDFPSFYFGSKLAFEDGLTPYNNSNWKLVRPLYEEGDLSPFLYPPPSLLIFRPFISLDYGAAKVRMWQFNQLLTLAFFYIFFFKILGFKADNKFLLLAAIYLFAFAPLLITIRNGQVSLWVLLSTCLAWWAAKEKAHPFWIALPLVFGIVLKVFPILLLVIFFFRKDYKTILYVLVLLVVVCLVATPFLPKGIWQDWYTEVASKGYVQEIRGMMMARPANQSINAFVTRLFFGLNVRFPRLLPPPSWVKVIPYVLGASVVMISLAASWWVARSRVPEPDNLNLQISIWLVVIFLVSPFSWQYHLVHILPAIYIALLHAIDRKKFLLLVLVSGLALLMAYDFPYNDLSFHEGLRTLLISCEFYAVVLLWLYFIYLAFWNKKSPGLWRFFTALKQDAKTVMAWRPQLSASR